MMLAVIEVLPYAECSTSSLRPYVFRHGALIQNSREATPFSPFWDWRRVVDKSRWVT